MLSNGQRLTQRIARTAAPLLRAADRVELLVPGTERDAARIRLPPWPVSSVVRRAVPEPISPAAWSGDESIDLLLLGVRRAGLHTEPVRALLENGAAPTLLRH